MRDPNEPSVFDHNAPYNESEDGRCDCFFCQREKRREAEAERVNDLIDEWRERKWQRG